MANQCNSDDFYGRWTFLLGALALMAAAIGTGVWIWREGDADIRQSARLRSMSMPPNAAGLNFMERKQRAWLTNKALIRLGRLYLATCQQGALPRGPDDLGEADSRDYEEIDCLNSARDEQPFVVVWGVRPSDAAEDGAKARLAWEASNDDLGGRFVLLADSKTVQYLTQEEFALLARAKPDGRTKEGTSRSEIMP
jgi:hypothetical protein